MCSQGIAVRLGWAGCWRPVVWQGQCPDVLRYRMPAGGGRSLLPSVGSGGGYPLWGNLCCWSLPAAALRDAAPPGLPGAEANRSPHPGSCPRALLKSSIELVIPHAYGVDLSENRDIHQRQLWLASLKCIFLCLFVS